MTSGGLNKKEMIGERFGFLTVVEESGSNNRGLAKWKCICDCGGELIIEGYYLRQGRRKSCGCKSTRKMGKENHRWSGYGEICGSYWHSIRAGAKQRGFALELTIEDAWELYLKQNGLCALTGMQLTMAASDHVRRIDRSLQTASLDRIDSDKGYVIGNVQWIHKDINLIKMQFDQDYFIELCKKVAEYNVKIDSSL